MTKIKEILIGTNNNGKYKEISDLLPKNIKKYSPIDFNIKSPEEDGKTFKDNSLIKAAYFSKKTNLICISDDSGLEIDLLDGKPGIHSARWGGPESNFDLAIKKVFHEIKKIKKNWKQNEITARFVCSLTIYWPEGKNHTTQGVVNGTISEKAKGEKGFGYDPIFIPNGFKNTFGEMNIEKKMLIDHRFKAYAQLKKFI